MSVYSNEVVVSNTPDVAIPAGVNVNNFPATQPISGSVSVSNFPATQPVSGTVSISGTVATTVGGVATATTTQITSNSSNQTLLASNANRKKAIFFFSSGVWDVKLGATASPTSRMLRINASNTLLEVTNYTGIIDAICTTNSKIVDVTEIA